MEIEIVRDGIDCWIVKLENVELYILLSLDDICGALYHIYQNDHVDTKLGVRSDIDAAIEFASDWLIHNKGVQNA